MDTTGAQSSPRCCSKRVSSTSPSFAGLPFPVSSFLFSILFLRGELRVAADSEELPYRAVLITGAGGSMGRQLVEALAQDRRAIETVVAGGGPLTPREMAAIMVKPSVALPAGAVTAGLWLLKKLGLTQYGPERVDFLRYRPVLSNRRVKEEFGCVPRKTTREVFEYFLEAQRNGATA